MRRFSADRYRLARRTGAALGLLLGAGGLATAAAPVRRAAPRLQLLVVVFDGLRPDQVTPALTPRLHHLAVTGVRSWQHHALFPTVTRVNASALATGTGPGGHGILDNTIYLPAVDSARVLNTGEAPDMQRADSVLDGGLLTAPTVAARLTAAGLRLMVASAGSSGSAYLFAGGGTTPVVNAELVRPAALAPLVARVLGAPPADASPNLGRNAWAVDALLRVGVDSLDVDVGYLWLSDPDHTAHGAGIGSDMADSSIRAADREFGRLIDGLAARGRREVNVIVVSDHGFSSHTGDTKSLRQRLGTLANNVVIAGSAIHVRQGGARVRDSVVRLLQAWPEAGAIFTAPGASRDEGIVRGTLSTAAIGWQHARSADVLWSADWSHEVNAVGYSGSTRQSGVAGHGTSSPHDIRATFVAHGPAFRKAAEAPLPSSNADIVPTVLHVLGQPSHAPGITGRPLLELLTTAPRTRGEARRDSVAVAAEGYRTVLFRTRVADTWYVDSTRTTRWAPR